MMNKDKKYASLREYQLIKLLGCGYNSKVKLGYKSETKEFVAIKIIKHSHPEVNLKVTDNEVLMIQKVQSNNIVKVIEYNPNAEYVKKSGTSYQCIAIVLELMQNGDFYEYIADVGRFPESLARAFFKLLLMSKNPRLFDVLALKECHGHGVCHRDLKPENLLFDADFNLKIGDFGFATLLKGKDGSGQLSTPVGTEPYMAPEIHFNIPYDGVDIDLFALGTILFTMMKGQPPFNYANPKIDQFYKTFLTKNNDFWSFHEKKLPLDSNKKFFSEDFKNLINKILSQDPKNRLNITQIMEHEWYKGKTADLEELKKEMRLRKMKIRGEADEKKLQDLKEKLEREMTKTAQSPTKACIKPFRAFDFVITKWFRQNQGLSSSEQIAAADRVLNTEYIEESGWKPSNVYSVVDPLILYGFILQNAKLFFNEFEEDPKKLKVSYYFFITFQSQKRISLKKRGLDR